MSLYHGNFPEFTQEDWNVFSEYGRTMLAVQEFEFFLARVVDEEVEEYNTASATSREDLYRRIDRLFRLTAGQLKSKLEKETEIPEPLLQELESAVRDRNDLAHRFLVFYRSEQRSWDMQRRLATDPEFRDPAFSDEQNETLRRIAIETNPKTPDAISREAMERLREQRENFQALEERLHAWWHEGGCESAGGP